MVFQRLYKTHFTIMTSVLAQLVILPRAHAMPESVYKKAILLAEKKAARNQILQMQLRNGADGLSPTLLKDIFGRQYKEGDSWDVAAWQFMSSTMRKTADTSKLSTGFNNGGIFHYEVIRSGSGQRLKLKITQLNVKGFKPVDPRFESIFLEVNETLSQSRKDYRLRGQTSTLSVSPEGIHSSMTPLELYPLDFPDVVTAEQKTPTSPPLLPNAIQDVANKLGFNVDPKRSKLFEQDDFFGRPIKIMWQEGDPWPAFIQTSGGISILIQRETQ